MDNMLITNALLIVVGFVLMIKGANWLVDGASSIASGFKIPKIIIGLTIVGFGTNTPELAVAFQSILTNNPDIIIGTVLGSNIMNILLILGLGGLASPLKIKDNTIRKEIPMVMLFSIAFVVLIFDVFLNNTTVNMISRSDGIIILLFFLIFVYYIVDEARKNNKNIKINTPKYTIKKSIPMFLLGLGVIIIGSNFVVSAATNMAVTLGISQKIIAMTFIALGTSLPEVVMAVISAKKGEHDILVGNIIGSNIFNICIAIGLPVSLFGGILINDVKTIDIFVFLMSTIVLFGFAKEDHVISKKESIFLIIAFILYYISLFII